MTDLATRSSQLSVDEQLACWLSNPIFSGEGESFCRQLAQSFGAIDFSANDEIVRCGEDASGIYVLLRGTVRVFHRTDDGRSVVVKLLSAPGTFGEMELLHNLPFLESVAAVNTATVTHIDRPAYLAMLEARPAMMMEQLRHLAAAFCIAAKNERQHFATLEQRVANLLIDFAELHGAAVDAPVLRMPRMTRKAIAAHLAASERGVANVLATFRKGELLLDDGDHWLLAEAAYFRELAAPVRHSLRYTMGMPLGDLSRQTRNPAARLAVIGGPRPCLGRGLLIEREALIGRGAGCALLLPG